MSFIKQCKGHTVDNSFAMSFIERTITISRQEPEDNYAKALSDDRPRTGTLQK